MKVEIHLYSIGNFFFTYVILSRQILPSRLKKNWYFLPDGWETMEKLVTSELLNFFIRFLHLITYLVAIFYYIHYLYIAISFLRQTISPKEEVEEEGLEVEEADSLQVSNGEWLNFVNFILNNIYLYCLLFICLLLFRKHFLSIFYSTYY